MALTACPLQHTPRMCAYVLRMLGAHPADDGSCEDSRRQYAAARASHGRAVVVFNHPTAFDYLVLVAELEERFRFVASASMTRLLRWITERYDMVLVDPSTPGNARRVADAAAQGGTQQLLAIAPAAGRSLADQCALPQFGTGAFVAGLPVIPVLLRWTPYERARWTSDEPMLTMMFRRFWGGGPLAYSLRVLEPIAPLTGEEAAGHAARVRDAMEVGLRAMEAGPRAAEGRGASSTTRVATLRRDRMHPLTSWGVRSLHTCAARCTTTCTELCVFFPFNLLAIAVAREWMVRTFSPLNTDPPGHISMPRRMKSAAAALLNVSTRKPPRCGIVPSSINLRNRPTTDFVFPPPGTPSSFPSPNGCSMNARCSSFHSCSICVACVPTWTLVGLYGV